MNGRLGSSWILAGLFAATAATAGLAGAGLAKGGPAFGGMHKMPGHMMATDPAAMDAHLDKWLGEMLPDSSVEQKTRLKAIARNVHGDLDAVHGQFRQTHQRAHELLLRPAIDRAALEALRVAQVRQIDTLSKRLFDELADAAEVLTPEQRARLAAQRPGH